MPGPFIIFAGAGDSSGMQGKFGLNDGTDLAGSHIYTVGGTVWDGTGAFISASSSIVAGDEPLINRGYGGGTLASGTAFVGDLVAFARKYRDGGYLPAGYDILLCPGYWAGTAYLNFWATTGNRAALDPFEAMVQWALTQGSNPSANIIGALHWDHGPNDGGQTQTQYQNNCAATWADMVSAIGHGMAQAPILVSNIPVNRYTTGLGGQTNLGGVVAAQRNCANVNPNAIYVNGESFNSYDNSNASVHHPACVHRGGLNTSPLPTQWVVGTTFNANDIVYGSDNCVYYSPAGSNLGFDPTTDAGAHWVKTRAVVNDTVTTSMADLKLVALRSRGWRMKANWNV